MKAFRPTSFIIVCLTYFLILTYHEVNGQETGASLFDNQVIHEIQFEFEQTDYWQQMEQNFDMTFGLNDQPSIIGKVTIDGELVDSVGVRFKGFTSYPYDSDKKPIKIDFNKYVNSRRYDGLRKLNLNNAFGDPSFQRDVLCYKMMREMGVKAPRTSWAKVYFQGEYWGLYQIIEQVDKEFLDLNFVDNDGNLFKNKGWSFLEWLGNGAGPYSEIFDLKTNESENDWSGFINLMDVINNTTPEEFEEQIESVFNVELFLRTLAVDVATNNWDSFMEHGRNWYMYQDSTTGIFHWIPWDYNFALGGSFFFDGPDECLIFPEMVAYTDGSATVTFENTSFYIGGDLLSEWDFGDGSPLVTGNNPSHEYATGGIYRVCLEMTVDDCVEKLCLDVDTTFDPATCSALEDSGHPADEVFGFVVANMKSCCNNWTQDCEEFWEFADQIINGGGVGQNNFDIDQSDNERLLIQRLMSIPEYENFYYNLFCQLNNRVMTEANLFEEIDDNVALINDAVEADPNILYGYDNFIEDAGEEGLKSYLTNRMDYLNSRIEELYTCPVPAVLDWQEVVINEFVASNDSVGGGIPDPEGGYPDWIELYNTTDRPLDFTGIFVSDDLDNLGKWEFPSGTTLNANGYVILWADNDIDQSGLHVSFKLSKSGESIYLSNSDGSIIDSISYGEQKTNIGYARVPNGSGDFQFWTTTFSADNDDGLSSTQDNALAAALRIYPNPVSESIFISLDGNDELQQLELSNAAGVSVSSKVGMGKEERMDVTHLPSGLYMMTVTSASGARTQKKVMVSR